MTSPTAYCSSCWATGRVVLVDIDVADWLMAVRVVLARAYGWGSRHRTRRRYRGGGG